MNGTPRLFNRPSLRSLLSSVTYHFPAGLGVFSSFVRLEQQIDSTRLPLLVPANMQMFMQPILPEMPSRRPIIVTRALPEPS